MIDVLNDCNIAAATIGNHDFDFGADVLAEHVKNCSFPWMLANCVDKSTGALLGNGLRKKVIENKGRRIGLMGLIEKEWLATLSTVDLAHVEYTDFVTVAREVEQELREVDGVDMVVAVTHFRLPNDERLAAEVPELDL